MVINGRAIAREILDELKIRVANLKGKGITPTLAIILIGNNPESEAYVEQKEIRAAKIGVDVKVFRLDKNVPESELIGTIERLNNDNNVHGIIVQRPVGGVSSEVLNDAVNPNKDVDGFHPNSPFDPPIAQAVFKILESIKVDLKNKRITIIGKGQTGGAPIIKALTKSGLYSLLNIIDSKTKEDEKEQMLKNSDIIISAVGKPNVISSKDIKKGSILISIGLSMGEDRKLHGDYDESDIKNVASFYTPTPGGVGPVNVAMLLKNLVEAAEQKSIN